LIYRTHAVCFLPLVAILDSPCQCFQLSAFSSGRNTHFSKNRSVLLNLRDTCVF
jgi:hypothetical protein